MKAKNNPFRKSSDGKYFEFTITIIALIFFCFCFTAIASANTTYVGPNETYTTQRFIRNASKRCVC